MKNILTVIVCFIGTILCSRGQLYSSQSVELSFYSKTPAEDIQAKSVKALGVLNVNTRELAFSVGNITFDFPNKLMEEHFNEKYMETEKYPNSTFKGKINEDVDLTRNGEYKVTVTGKLNIHGVEQERTIPGVIVVKDGVISIQSMFKVKVADHNITVPKLVIAKIAEEIDVRVDAKLIAKR